MFHQNGSWRLKTMPLSLFCDNGQMETTQKPEFFEKRDGLIEPETVLMTVKDVDSIVCDGMAIIQMLPVPILAAKPTHDDLTPPF